MLDERAQVLEQLRDLEREHGLLTLLCRERGPIASLRCHRLILADLLAGLAPADPSDSSRPAVTLNPQR